MTKGKDRKIEREERERKRGEGFNGRLDNLSKNFSFTSPSPSLFFPLNFVSFFPFVNNSWGQFHKC